MRRVAVEVMPDEGEVAVTSTVVRPFLEGFHMQEEFQVDADPVVRRETHPGRRTPSTV
jgi:hypothetical protein